MLETRPFLGPQRQAGHLRPSISFAALVPEKNYKGLILLNDTAGLGICQGLLQGINNFLNVLLLLVSDRYAHMPVRERKSELRDRTRRTEKARTQFGSIYLIIASS